MDSLHLCRLCSGTSYELINVFETFNNLTIASILAKHFWFEVNENDGLSEWLCKMCWMHTKMFHSFYKKIEFLYGNISVRFVEKDKVNPDVNVGIGNSFCSDLIKQERSDNPQEAVLVPDLIIVKWEEAERIEVIGYSDSCDNNDDNSCDPSEITEYSDDEDQTSKEERKTGDSSATGNQTLSRKSKNDSDTQDAKMREFCTMKCDICSYFELESFLGAKVHYRIIHKISGYLICCNMKFTHRSALLKHIRQHSNTKQDANIREFSTMKCDICSDVEFETLLTAKQHYRIVHKMNGYLMCCDKKFTHRSALLAHISQHTNAKREEKDKQNAQIREFCTMKCDFCNDVEFETISNASKHYHIVHKIRGYLRCCGNKYAYRRELLNHIRIHINPDEHHCEPCGKSFTRKSSLQNHIENHVPLTSRAHKCSLCSSSFTKATKLKHHVKSKHSWKTGEMFTCDICDKSYKSKLVLTCHFRNVHESHKHVCEICARSFKTKQKLRYHSVCEHSTAPRPKVQYNICGAWLAHQPSLRRHHITQHQDLEDHNCPICNKTKKTKNELDRHVRRVHGEKSHQCVLCSKAFTTAKVLKEHVAIHTGEDLYNCPYCEKKFKSNANMYTHRKKAHITEWTRDFSKNNNKIKSSRTLSGYTEDCNFGGQ